MSTSAPDKGDVKKLHDVQLSHARTARYREWRAAMHKLEFIADPRAAAKAIAHDGLAPNAQRILQWLKLRAWGSYSLYCVLDNGEPAFAADCARELNIDKSSVSRSFAYLEMRGYLQRHGVSKKLYPVMKPDTDATAERLARGKTSFAEFVENWSAANSATFEKLSAARSAIKEIRQTILTDYRAARNAERAAAATGKGHRRAAPAESPAPQAQAQSATVPDEVKTALETAIPSNAPFSQRSAAALVTIARETAAAAGQTVSDGEIAGAIAAAAAAASGRGVRHIGFFKVAVPEKIEAVLEERRAEVQRAAEFAKKCPTCRGSRRDPVFPQDDCRTCHGTGLPPSPPA